jgi:hypothetical protein
MNWWDENKLIKKMKNLSLVIALFLILENCNGLDCKNEPNSTGLPDTNTGTTCQCISPDYSWTF